MEKKRKRLISISVLLGILIGLLYLFYSYFMKTEVYVSFDETRSGSTLYIDSKKVRSFKKTDTSDFESFFFYVERGKHEFRLSKQGMRDIVDSVEFTGFGGEYYMDFSFKTSTLEEDSLKLREFLK